MLVLILQEDAEEFGIDWDGSCVLEDVESVEIPTVECPLQPQEMAILQTYINPLADCTDFGVGLYIATRQIIMSCL